VGDPGTELPRKLSRRMSSLPTVEETSRGDSSTGKRNVSVAVAVAVVVTVAAAVAAVAVVVVVVVEVHSCRRLQTTYLIRDSPWNRAVHAWRVK
jgi:hypothetical protein